MQTSSVACRCGASVAKCDLKAVEVWNTRQHIERCDTAPADVVEQVAKAIVKEAWAIEGLPTKAIIKSENQNLLAKAAIAAYEQAKRQVDVDELIQGMAGDPEFWEVCRGIYTGKTDRLEGSRAVARAAVAFLKPYLAATPKAG